MNRNPNETNFRCCFGILSRDHGAFNYLYRWSLRHMLTEILVVGLLIYLALQDALIGLWSTLAAVISLLGASIPTCCFSNAMGWRANFVIQIVVCVIRVAVVSYIIVFFTKVSFTENSLVPIRDMDLIAVRICQLACILLSTCSLSPFFHLSFKSPWMINLRPVDDNFRVNNNQGERNYNGHEGLMTDRSDNRSERGDNYYDDPDYYPQKGHHSRGGGSFDSQSQDDYQWQDRNNKNRYNENNHSHHNHDGNGREIENIEEGNEDIEDEDEDGEYDDNTTHKSSGDKKPAMSMASMSPFYHSRKTSVFDFANKQEKDFQDPVDHSQRSSVTSTSFAPPQFPYSSNASVNNVQPHELDQLPYKGNGNKSNGGNNNGRGGRREDDSNSDNDHDARFHSPPDSPEKPVTIRKSNANTNKSPSNSESNFAPKSFAPKVPSPVNERLPSASDSSSGTSSRLTPRGGKGDHESGSSASGSSGSTSVSSPQIRERSELKDHSA